MLTIIDQYDRNLGAEIRERMKPLLSELQSPNAAFQAAIAQLEDDWGYRILDKVVAQAQKEILQGEK